ncbi:MAG: acetyl-CoA carboxylase biotin carboxyl carrier protein subunit [Bacteroidota bacterium]|nr:acetyl-CoA carboxylase biotin carboxyl carrier protein subunit [Bacteroidota bacterium]MDE2833473.1 acetyl-CoA carboxylase biotin carboxyl carrier protein subunit [Bacteroidota bacterium]MDE2958124.1 acetyl-CoA carboxylase biotin carboxyl carrier protein subunit [Bacteroidota bacterium]
MAFSVAATHRPLHVTCDGGDFEIEILDGHLIINGEKSSWSAVEADHGTVSLLLGGDSYEFHIEQEGPNTYAVTMGHHTRRVQVHREFARPSGGAGPRAGPSVLSAPMPGMVRQVMVSPGDTIKAGQGLVVLEAMKMENELRATGPGRVRAVHIESGQAVTRDMVLLEFDP